MEAPLLVSLLLFGELVLAYAAQGADPILGKIFKRSARGDSIVRITHSGIITVAANIAHIDFHWFVPPSKLIDRDGHKCPSLSFIICYFPSIIILY